MIQVLPPWSLTVRPLKVIKPQLERIVFQPEFFRVFVRLWVRIPGRFLYSINSCSSALKVWKIIVLSKWVICRFQPLIFQGLGFVAFNLIEVNPLGANVFRGLGARLSKLWPLGSTVRSRFWDHGRGRFTYIWLKRATWQFFVTFLRWLIDPFKG